MSKLLRLLFYLVVGMCFFYYLFYSEYDRVPNWGEDLNLMLFALVTSIVAGFGITGINTLLNRKLPWRKNVFVRFMAGLGSDFLFLGFVLILFGWLANITGIIEYEMFPEDLFIRQIEIKLMVLSFITFFVITLVEFNGYSYNEYSVGQIRKLRAERKQLELQFEALKSQLSPHYLFNSMNTISSLVYRDADVAESFIRNLADTFNYVLHTKDVKSVPLKEEIEALKDYRYLLMIRYNDAIGLNIEVDEARMEDPIPPLTLQLLVENAVKHNIISSDQPLKINIRNTETHLVVLNNKTGAPSKTASHRVGLDNIRKRYAFFSKEEISIRNEDYFEVKLPLLS
ncbi:sensor histidine kinase [Roseivirga pacifica]|uniref:sensor histidine kinase n=1 Tax=Roseivirga pacifica TaxID=1267423 RepID=UPI003BA94998